MSRTRLLATLDRIGTVFPAAALASVLASLIGCEAGGPTEDGRYPIRGNVTVGGRPIDSGSILFRPEADARLQGAGAVIRGGRYGIEAGQGLRAGRYAAEILEATRSTPRPGVAIDEITGAEVPTSPARAARSNPFEAKGKVATGRHRRIVEVTGAGPNTFDFELTN